MKPTKFWLGCLAMAGSCLVAAGCGGSDVPDPASDSSAAAEPTSKVYSGGPAAASAPEAPAAPAEPTAAAPAPAPTAEPEPAKVASAVAPAPAPGETPEPTAEAAPALGDPATPTPKVDASGTEEMLRMGTAPAPAPAAAPGADAVASNPGSNGNAAPAAGPIGGMAGPGGPGGGPGRTRQEMETGGAPAGGGMAGPGNNRQGGPMGGPGAGSFGSAGGPGGADADPGPGAFRNPATAVNAFLSALRAKNKDRLSQATARRAAREAAEKHQKIFAAILDQSISDEELDDMAKALEGFRVQSILPAKSTGQIGVLISKMDNRDRLQKTVNVRLEKEGWKVMDFGGTVDFKPVGTYRRPGSRR